MVLMAKKDPKAFVTNETLGEAVGTILGGMDDLIERQNEHLDQRFNKVDKRLDRIESEVTWVKDDIKGLTADLSVRIHFLWPHNLPRLLAYKIFTQANSTTKGS